MNLVCKKDLQIYAMVVGGMKRPKVGEIYNLTRSEVDSVYKHTLMKIEHIGNPIFHLIMNTPANVSEHTRVLTFKKVARRKWRSIETLSNIDLSDPYSLKIITSIHDNNSKINIFLRSVINYIKENPEFEKDCVCKSIESILYIKKFLNLLVRNFNLST